MKLEVGHDDRYNVLYRHGGEVFFRSRENGFHMGDTLLSVKWNLLDPLSQSFGLAARGGLELPTGNEESGFGSGRLDGTVGLLGQKLFTPSFAGYAGLDHVFRKSPTSFRGIGAAHVTHAHLSFEKVFSETLSATLQSDYQTQPLDGGKIQEYDRPEWSLSFGVGFRMGEGVGLRVFFVEDLITHTTPDFVAGMSLSLAF